MDLGALEKEYKEVSVTAGELERAISRYALTHNRVVKGIDVSVALDSLFKNGNEQITIRVNK